MFPSWFVFLLNSQNILPHPVCSGQPAAVCCAWWRGSDTISLAASVWRRVFTWKRVWHCDKGTPFACSFSFPATATFIALTPACAGLLPASSLFPGLKMTENGRAEEGTLRRDLARGFSSFQDLRETVINRLHRVIEEAGGSDWPLRRSWSTTRKPIDGLIAWAVHLVAMRAKSVAVRRSFMMSFIQGLQELSLECLKDGHGVQRRDALPIRGISLPRHVRCQPARFEWQVNVGPKGPR